MKTSRAERMETYRKEEQDNQVRRITKRCWQQFDEIIEEQESQYIYFGRETLWES